MKMIVCLGACEWRMFVQAAPANWYSPRQITQLYLEAVATGGLPGIAEICIMVQKKQCFVLKPFSNTNSLPEVWEEESPCEFHEIQCCH